MIKKIPTRFVKRANNIINRKQSGNESWADLFNKSLNEIYIFDKDTLQFEYVNVGAQKNLGYSMEQLEKMTPLDIKPEFTSDSFHDLIRPLLRNERKILVFETVHLRADGTRYPIEVHLQLFKQGKSERFLALILDITERKKIEEVQVRLATLVEATSDYASVADLDKKLLYLNDAGKEMIGLGKDVDISTLRIQDVHPAWAYALISEKGIPHALKEGTWKGETALLHRDGHQIPVSQVIVVHKDKEGKVDLMATIMRDITEQKRTEEQLAERERMLNEAQKVAGLGVYKTDFTINRWESSDVLDEIFGIDKDYVRSVDGWASLIHPDDRNMMTEYLQNEVFAKKHDFDKEYRIIQQNTGNQLWVHGLGKMTFDKKNHPLTMVGTIQDISERKKNEDNLKESESRLNLNIQNMPAGMIEWDQNFCVVRWNPAAEMIFGHTKNEAMGKHANFIIPKQVRPHVDQIWNLLLSGSVTQSTNENITKDGRIIICDWHNAPLKSLDGKVFGVVSMMLDVTEQKKNEKNLEELSERYKAVTNSAKDVIITADNDGNVVDWNNSATKIFGFKREEVEGKPLDIIIPPKYKGKHHTGISRVQQGGDRQIIGKTSILEGLRRDGHTFPIELSLSEWDVAGKHYYTAIIRDITDRKMAEDTLRESEEKYRTLVDVAPLCIKWFDAKGNLISINQHGREEHFLLSKSDDQIKKWDFIGCIENKYQDLVRQSMKRAYEGVPSEFDIEHVPGTTTGHWCHTYIVPAFDSKGSVKYILFISRDFSAEKVAEDKKNETIGELEKFKDLTIGRELKMIELKKENQLLKKNQEDKNN